MARWLAPLLALLVWAATASGARAAEEILSYDSYIVVEPDGDLDVTETIQVRAEGFQIRRGIYRDFPLRFRDAEGRLREVGFDLLSLTRDGRPEPHRIEYGKGFLRIYAGSADVLLAPGVYTYAIRYRTDRQIRFFDNHDEVYWNVTGTEWDFPIRRASADVILPNGALATETAYYTGPYGSTERNARSTTIDDGARVRFETTRPLGPREGLTLMVGMPKGAVAPPDQRQQAVWFWRDHAGSILAASGLAIVFFYYFGSWVVVGRDPSRGVIVPRWDMPDGVSPALVHYIDAKGLWADPFRAISAAVLDLAVKGFVTLDDVRSDLVIKRTEKPAGTLPTGEKAIVQKLHEKGGTLRINKANGVAVAQMRQRFANAMSDEHRAAYYRFNVASIVGGVLLSVGVIALTLWLGRVDEDAVVGLAGTAILGGGLIWAAVRWGRSRPSGLIARISLIISIAIPLVFAVAAGGTMIGATLTTATSPFVIGGIAAIVMLNVLFFFLLGAPTPLGRRRMDEIEGLRRYLSVAEEDRMNMQGAPQMSPQHYETLLPYAVALGLERPWSEAFQAWLLTAAAAGAVAAAWHGPSWYHGDRFSPDRIGETMGGLADSMASSMTASLPAPKSSSSGSSSGGGGFSGGGGGGGGGGGW